MIIHSSYQNVWQLWLEEAKSAWNQEALINPLTRVIEKMESLYAYEFTRHSLENYFSKCKCYKTLRIWNYCLLFAWYKQENHKQRLHWMKLWMDHVYRLRVIHGIEVQWQEIRTILNCWPSGIVRFHKEWKCVYNSFKQLIEVKHTEWNMKKLNHLELLRKIIVLTEFYLSFIHPMTWNKPAMDQYHFLTQRSNPLANLISVKRDDCILSRELQEQRRNAPLMLPLLHSKHPYIMDIMVATKSIFRLVNKVHTIIRTIHNVFKNPMYHLSYIIDRMQNGSRYYSQRSSYTESFQEIYRLLKETLQKNTQDYLLQRLNSTVQNRSLYKIIYWNMKIFRNAGWMPDYLFQTIGFSLIPFQRMQLVNSERKWIPKWYLNSVVALLNTMYTKKWGNIQHLSSILVFLSNSQLPKIPKRMNLYRAWMVDPRFCSPNSPQWSITQSYQTNQRLLFHLMQKGWYPKKHLSNFIMLLCQELNYIKQNLLTQNTNADNYNQRLQDETIYRTMGLPINNTFDIENITNILNKLLPLFNQTVVKYHSYQNFICQTHEWLRKIKTIPRLSFIQLEESITTLQIELEKQLYFIEKTPNFLQLEHSFQRRLLENPTWRYLLTNSDLSESRLKWWNLPENLKQNNEDEEQKLDVITHLPIENPVSLPSGQVVDKATYSMLLSTSGKDPYTLAELPPLSSLESTT